MVSDHSATRLATTRLAATHLADICNTGFIVSAQAAVAWNKRGAATSRYPFPRAIEQAVGAAGLHNAYRLGCLLATTALVGALFLPLRRSPAQQTRR
jgi:hypothetical protein